MSDPKRWLSSLDHAPPGVRELLSAYPREAPIPADVHARLLARAVEIAALKPLGIAALLASKPGIATVAVVIAGSGALAAFASHEPAPVPPAPLVTTVAPAARAARATSVAAAPSRESTIAVEELAVEPPAEKPTRVRRRWSPAHQPVPALVEEAAFVDRARAALDTDPAASLRVCQEYGRQFPKGQLGAACQTLRMRALRALGRTAEAREQARALLVRDPKTLHAEEAARLAAEKD